MANFTKEILSGSTYGKPISVVATVIGSADTIHTAPAMEIDEITLFASNTSGADVILTVALGGVTAADELDIIVPANDSVTVLAGAVLTNGLILKAFAATTAVINVYGYVNRIS